MVFDLVSIYLLKVIINDIIISLIHSVFMLFLLTLPIKGLLSENSDIFNKEHVSTKYMVFGN